MAHPLVSVITINYNQSRVTRDLLLSLRKISYPAVEILVVDNASPSDTPGMLAEEFPKIQLIESQENLGFSGGNNLGVAASSGKYLLFINNDTEVEPDFLEPLVDLMERHPDIGMVSPKIRFYHQPELIQYAGYHPYRPVTLRQHLIGYREPDRGQYDQGRETFGGHGAAMMVPRRVLDQVGSLADLFFLYYEEHDWSERIKRAGFRIWFEPRSVVWHKESVTTGKDSPLKTYYLTRNRIVFARRNVRGLKRFFTLLYLYNLVPLKFSFTYLKSRSYKNLRAAWRGTFWNLAMSGRRLRKL